MNNDPMNPQPMPGAAPAPAPQPAPQPAPAPAPAAEPQPVVGNPFGPAAPAPAPAPAAGPQPVVGNPFAPTAGAPAGGASNKKAILIAAIAGGVVLIIGIVIAIIFITASKTLSCEQTLEYGTTKQVMKTKLGFMFGSISSLSMTEEYSDTEGVSDEYMKYFEMTDAQKDEGNYKSYDIKRKDDNTIIIEAELDIAKAKEKAEKNKEGSSKIDEYDDYDKAKEYLEKQGMTRK